MYFDVCMFWFVFGIVVMGLFVLVGVWFVWCG